MTDLIEEDAAGNTDPDWVARQAARLIESIEQADTGALAARATGGGEPVIDRPTIATVEERLWRERVAAVMWTIDSNPKYRTGNAYDHRQVAERVVRALFPLPSRMREAS
jgi:hypothetical protein